MSSSSASASAIASDHPGSKGPIRVLFVCLGNICRSPMAHAVFEDMARPKTDNDTTTAAAAAAVSSSRPLFEVDSAGTGAYHAGDDPDSRTLWTLQKHGITDFSHAARRVRPADFRAFDYVLAMDSENLADLEAVRDRVARDGGGGGSDGSGRPLAKLAMFGDYGGGGEDIVDPYYGGGEGFEVAYQQCARFSQGFLEDVLGQGWERTVRGEDEH